MVINEKQNVGVQKFILVLTKKQSQDKMKHFIYETFQLELKSFSV